MLFLYYNIHQYIKQAQHMNARNNGRARSERHREWLLWLLKQRLVREVLGLPVLWQVDNAAGAAAGGRGAASAQGHHSLDRERLARWETMCVLTTADAGKLMKISAKKWHMW